MPSLNATEWLIVLWLFAVGAAVGSFLNVVIYRLPLGMSLIYPPSHCPKCGKRIPWYDNVPIFGWIALRGRCRQCRDPISARYPTIEAITALIFGILAVVEFASDGANLPIRSFKVGDNMYLNEWSMSQLYGRYLYHVMLLCTLLCAAMIEYDGKPTPRRLFIPALIVGLCAPLMWPDLRPVGAWFSLSKSTAGAIDGLVGLSAGVLVAAAVWLAMRNRKPVGPALSFLCIGAFLGWQATLGIAAATAAIQILACIVKLALPSLRILPSMSLGIVTLVWILLWARLVSL